MKDQEIEVKFYVRDLGALEQRLQSAGAICVQTRVRETNLRFDNARNNLTRANRVLRLRKDHHAFMTFKGPAETSQGVADRLEIEFQVSDFDAARLLLEALGYHVVVEYEKYRATYDLENAHITLDEMPYGSFCEIEGEDAPVIQKLAARLDLAWETRILTSYLALFNQLKHANQLRMLNLTFDAFEGLTITPEDLGVIPADQL